MATVFFSYSHADEGLRDHLEKHLSALKHRGVIETWHDRRILAGQALNPEIDSHIESADIILLLVSPDFLASDYCYRREMQRAMERHQNGSAIVIPVILRPCDWHDTPFGGLRAAPKDGRPITLWPNADEAFLDVVNSIKAALANRRRSSKIHPPIISSAAAPEPSPVIRSSNLRVAKRFSQLDKDRFLHECFEYLAKFFENSLHDLAGRNPDTEGSFRRIDANRFTAVAYRDGEKRCHCTIFLGGMSGGISYSMRDDARTNSFNESLLVEVDDQSLYLKSLGMQSLGKSSDKLSFQGAAELFWSLFIAPLQ
jgi:hypothetical protein